MEHSSRTDRFFARNSPDCSIEVQPVVAEGVADADFL